jgi:hypothetical protein
MGDTYLPIKFPWPGFLRGVHHPGPRLCGQTQGWDQIFCWPQGKRPQSNFIALLLATLVILHLEKSILVIASSSDFSDWLHLYLSAIKVPKFSLVYIQLQSPGGWEDQVTKALEQSPTDWWVGGGFIFNLSVLLSANGISHQDLEAWAGCQLAHMHAGTAWRQLFLGGGLSGQLCSFSPVQTGSGGFREPGVGCRLFLWWW